MVLPASSSRTNSFVAVLLVIAVLYLGQEVLIPFALALLLTFLLAPAVQRLPQLRLPRLCLVVIGKYVPQLQFLNILLGEKPAVQFSS